jgi:hypothetical protein
MRYGNPPAPPRFAFEGIPFEYGEPFRCLYCYTEQVVKNKIAWKQVATFALVTL